MSGAVAIIGIAALLLILAVGKLVPWSTEGDGL